MKHPGLPFTLTESKAIIQFLGRTYKLYGTSEVEHALVDNIIYRAEDVRASFTKIAYGSKNWAHDEKEFKAGLGAQLAPFEKLLASRTTKWSASNTVTTADVFLFEVLEVLSQFSPDTFKNLPKCVEFREAVRALPQLQKALEAASKLSFNGSEAHWSGPKK